jgi:23S rRNA pseudouridine1911/1915/1917 synthase
VVQPQAAPEDTPSRPKRWTLDIVFEDEAHHGDQQAGRPGRPSWRRQLVRHAAQRPAAPLPALAGVPRAGIVHRLDKDTSGLMVVGKTLAAQTDLVRQLQARTVKREYFALVWGTPQLSGTIDAVDGPPPARPRQDGGVERFRPSRRSPITSGSPPACWTAGRSAWCSASLETGRTHQIRVHMQSLGFALVGDAVYGKPHLPGVPAPGAAGAPPGPGHPATGERCEWIVPLAADFAELLEARRHRAAGCLPEFNGGTC